MKTGRKKLYSGRTMWKPDSWQICWSFFFFFAHRLYFVALLRNHCPLSTHLMEKENSGLAPDEIPFRIRWKLPAQIPFSFQHKLQAVGYLFGEPWDSDHMECGDVPLCRLWERNPCQTARFSLHSPSFKMINLHCCADETFSLSIQRPCPNNDGVAKVLGIKKGSLK